jgi:hypothetical protein
LHFRLQMEVLSGDGLHFCLLTEVVSDGSCGVFLICKFNHPPYRHRFINRHHYRPYSTFNGVVQPLRSVILSHQWGYTTPTICRFIGSLGSDDGSLRPRTPLIRRFTPNLGLGRPSIGSFYPNDSIKRPIPPFPYLVDAYPRRNLPSFRRSLAIKHRKVAPFYRKLPIVIRDVAPPSPSDSSFYPKLGVSKPQHRVVLSQQHDQTTRRTISRSRRCVSATQPCLHSSQPCDKTTEACAVSAQASDRYT